MILSSIRVLGTVGEPINEEAWNWYYEVVGKKGSPIVDTWWQTETGGILITGFTGASQTTMKPCSCRLIRYARCATLTLVDAMMEI